MEKMVSAHGRPIPAHERALLHGALPPDFDLSDVEQERRTPVTTPILVQFNGPQMVHNQPSHGGAPFSQIVNAQGDTVLGADLRRKRAVIISNDLPFYYSTQQVTNPNTASACLWPANVPLPLENGDAVWCAAAPVTVPASTSPTYATVAAAAAAAASVNLPAGVPITGFDVVFDVPAAAVNTTVTVSGLTGANIVYDVTESATVPTTLEIRFPAPLPATNGATQVNVAVAAIAGGAAYTITAYGSVPVAASQAAATIATLGIAVEIYAD